MLVFNTQAKETGDGFSLALNASHVLSTGYSSNEPVPSKGRPSEDSDVVLKTDLVLSFAAVADSQHISASCMRTSSCLRHVLAYLKLNGDQLGLSMVSDLYVDDQDGRTKVTLSSAWPYGSPFSPRAPTRSSLYLNTIDITFVLKSIGFTESFDASSMFSGRSYLPFCTLLNRTLQKFVTLHLVRKSTAR
ncbi:hypothetical protein BC835DRAFT_229664 [Cytidiella melzeri]|nr:hypothetical protein BC835DRAFT_229664 [Cytidiella melzeri]